MKSRGGIVMRVLLALFLLTGAAAWVIGARSPGAQGTVGNTISAAMKDAEVVDLSVLISEQLPAHWPTHAPFQRWTFNWFKPVKGPYSDNYAQSVFPYYGQRYVIDEHTGTQLDCPAHFIPPEGSGLPFAGPMGKMTCDKMSVTQWLGPAVVVDVRAILDKAPNGKSPIITLQMIRDWEAKNGAFQKGEIILFYSGYSDKYYKPFPEGNRLAFEPLILQNKPGWPSGSGDDGVPELERHQAPRKRRAKHGARRGRAGHTRGGAQVRHDVGRTAHERRQASRARRLLHRAADENRRRQRRHHASDRDQDPRSEGDRRVAVASRRSGKPVYPNP